MADLNWYNVNANRDFPLVGIAELDGANLLPKSAILDLGLVMGGESEFDALADAVWLSRVEHDGSDITLTFLASPYGSQVEFTAVFTSNSAATPAGTVVGITSDTDQGYGFVVVGDVDELVLALDGDTSSVVTAAAGGNAEVEPSRIISQAGSIVTSVSALHRESTRWENLCASSSLSEPGDGSSVIPSSSEVWYEDLIDSGADGAEALYFDDGYNTDIVLNTDENSITIRAGVGSGEGEPCNWDDQGEPRCGDVIMAINGISAADNGIFVLQGGSGIEIVPGDENELVVQVGSVSDMYCSSTPG